MFKSSFFQQTPIFLFFNKKDLFEEYLRKYPLSNIFPEYKGGDNLHEGLKFMEDQFKSKVGSSTSTSSSTSTTSSSHSSSKLFRSWPISARFKKDIQYSLKELMDELCHLNHDSISKAISALKKQKKNY